MGDERLKQVVVSYGRVLSELVEAKCGSSVVSERM